MRIGSAGRLRGQVSDGRLHVPMMTRCWKKTAGDVGACSSMLVLGRISGSLRRRLVVSAADGSTRTCSVAGIELVDELQQLVSRASLYFNKIA